MRTQIDIQMMSDRMKKLENHNRRLTRISRSSLSRLPVPHPPRSPGVRSSGGAGGPSFRGARFNRLLTR